MEAVRADLLEAAKVTGSFEVTEAAPSAVSTTAEGEDAAVAPVAVSSVELGEPPAKR